MTTANITIIRSIINKFEGRCFLCGCTVIKGHGLAEQVTDSVKTYWRNRHDVGCCYTKADGWGRLLDNSKWEKKTGIRIPLPEAPVAEVVEVVEAPVVVEVAEVVEVVEAPVVVEVAVETLTVHRLAVRCTTCGHRTSSKAESVEHFAGCSTKGNSRKMLAALREKIVAYLAKGDATRLAKVEAQIIGIKTYIAEVTEEAVFVIGSTGNVYKVAGQTCTCKGNTYRGHCSHAEQAPTYAEQLRQLGRERDALRAAVRFQSVVA
jgi:hypothetical protein